MTRSRLAVLGMIAALGFAGQLCASPTEHARYFRSSDGAALAHFEKGSGPPVVLLAGGNALSHGYPELIADALAVTHRVILPDQCGTGLSKPGKYNRATLNLDKLVEDLDALRMHLGLRKLNLMGHSWGGMPAMPYAAVHSNRIESMVLVGSGGMDLAFLPLPAAGTAARLKLVLPPEEQKRLETLMATTAAPPMPEQVKSEISHLRSAAMFHDRRRAELQQTATCAIALMGYCGIYCVQARRSYRNVRIVRATSSDRKS